MFGCVWVGEDCDSPKWLRWIAHQLSKMCCGLVVSSSRVLQCGPISLAHEKNATFCTCVRTAGQGPDGLLLEVSRAVVDRSQIEYPTQRQFLQIPHLLTSNSSLSSKLIFEFQRWSTWTVDYLSLPLVQYPFQQHVPEPLVWTRIETDRSCCVSLPLVQYPFQQHVPEPLVQTRIETDWSRICV